MPRFSIRRVSNAAGFSLTVVLGAAIVAGAGVAAASTGAALMLGQANTAPRTTTLTSTTGSALTLNVPDGTAPLRVRSSSAPLITVRAPSRSSSGGS